MSGARVRRTHGAAEYPELVRIWRSAVDATHDFLTPEHREEIEARLASDYLPGVSLQVAERDGRPVGFSGIAEGRLEMLFVAADERGRGTGTILLDDAIRERGVTALDVNEQNTQAVGFYLHRGFVVVGHSDTDEAGRPYPLLHLALPRT